jgi:hypothetical protein
MPRATSRSPSITCSRSSPNSCNYRAGLGLAALAEAVGSETEADSQRRQILLNAVVKILGDTLPFRIRRREYGARRMPSP